MNDLSAVDVLLVEDSANDAELTLRTLEEHNLANKVLWVKDGEEAMRFFFDEEGNAKPSRNPRVVLLDLRLPKVNGLELLRELKNHTETKAIPVVVLSSSTQDEDMVQSYSLGVNSYVPKPVKFDKFSEVVSQLGMYWLLVNRQPSEC